MGLMCIGGNAMATQVNVDSATKDMPGKVESTRLSVPVKTPVINQISDVVYEQVPMRGYPNVAMKMDILQPKSAAKLPAIVTGTDSIEKGLQEAEDLTKNEWLNDYNANLNKH